MNNKLNYLKGKTYEEVFGVERATALKEKQRLFMKKNCPMFNESSLQEKLLQ